MAAPKGNKFAAGNKGGRPPIFTTAPTLQAMVDEYFAQEDVKFTICGLALYLGFTSRQSLFDYQEKEEFADIIKKARLRVEQSYEEGLHQSACAGSIFALKNMGWSDKMELTGKDGKDLYPAPRVLTKEEARQYLHDLESGC